MDCSKVLFQTVENIIAYFPAVCQLFYGQNLTLSLLVALVLRADDHNFSVSLDDLALVAHGLDGRTYFHDDVLLICVFKVIWRRRRSGSRVGRNDARKRDNELRRKFFPRDFRRSFEQDEECEQFPTGVYSNVNDRGNAQARQRIAKETQRKYSGNSSASDKERAQTTTGAYTDVRDRGVRNRDAVSREKYFPDQDLLRQVILPFVKS